MATAARLALAAWRNELCVRTIRIVGMDLTAVAAAGGLRAQVRLLPDTPGAANIALETVTTAAAEGIKLDSVVWNGGVPTSTLIMRINKTTMSSATSLPYSGEIGNASRLAWALQIDGKTRVYGDFWALAAVMDADGAPSSRPINYYTAKADSPWSASTLTFTDDSVNVTIDGADILSAISSEAAEYRDEAGASAAAAAVSAATAESVAGPTYANTTAGLAATSDGEAFAVDNGDGTVTVYLNDSGTAVEQRTLATTDYLASASGGSSIVGFILSATGAKARTSADKHSDTVNVWDFLTDAMKADVAAGTLLVDCSSGIQAAIDECSGKNSTGDQTGRKLYFRAGKYLVENPLTFVWRNTGGDNFEADARKLTISGEGSGNTILISTVSTISLSIAGYYESGGSGTFLNVKISDLSIKQKDEGASRNGTGLSINHVSGVVLDQVASRYFATGLNIDDSIYGTVRDCDFGGNAIGVSGAVPEGGFTNPNGWLFTGTQFGGCSQKGVFLQSPSQVKFDTCFFEGIGTDRTLTGASACYSVHLQQTPDQGACGGHLSNCYFENNEVAADIYFEWGSTSSGTVKVESTYFGRVNTSRFALRHITFSQSNTGKMNAHIDTCGFKHATYDPAVQGPNPVWEIASSNVHVTESANVYDSPTELPRNNGFPTWGRLITTLGAAGTITNDGTAGVAAGRNHNIDSVVRNSIGDVTINLKTAFQDNSYMPNGWPAFIGAGRVEFYSGTASAVSFRTYASDGTTLADRNFNFQIWGQLA